MSYSLPFLVLPLLLIGCIGHKATLLRPSAALPRDGGGHIILDRGHHRIVFLDAKGEFLSETGGLGRDPQQLYSPWDLDFDSKGNIYTANFVVDASGSSTASDGVKVFRSDGVFLREVGHATYKEGETANKPYGIFVDSADRLYTADQVARTVRIFDANGSLLTTLFGEKEGEPRQVESPTDVAYNEKLKRLYIPENGLGELRIFQLIEEEGTFKTKLIRTTSSFGSNPGQLSYPSAVTIDPESQEVIVSDMGNIRISVFDAEGKFLRSFAPANRLAQYYGIWWNKLSKRLIIADVLNNNIITCDRFGNSVETLRGTP